MNTGVERGTGVPHHSTIGTGRDIKQQPSSHKANVIGKSHSVPLLPFSTPFVLAEDIKSVVIKFKYDDQTGSNVKF